MLFRSIDRRGTQTVRPAQGHCASRSTCRVTCPGSTPITTLTPTPLAIFGPRDTGTGCIGIPKNNIPMNAPVSAQGDRFSPSSWEYIKTNSWTSGAVLLACVALGDLASYGIVALRASDPQRIHSLVRNDDLRDGAGCMRNVARLTRKKCIEMVIGTFTFLESGIFIRFNLRRQV